MQTWSTVDKSEWEDGPWLTEPDKVYWTDEITGFPCLAVRGPSGAWCGYVGIDNTHPIYGKGYDDAYNNEDEWFDVHGGLTFADFTQKTKSIDTFICHTKEEMAKVIIQAPDLIWWFGFDCAHSGDLCPAYNKLRNGENPEWRKNDIYRNLEYIKTEITKLAQQLQIR